jgi:hypothetical protein
VWKRKHCTLVIRLPIASSLPIKTCWIVLINKQYAAVSYLYSTICATSGEVAKVRLSQAGAKAWNSLSPGENFQTTAAKMFSLPRASDHHARLSSVKVAYFQDFTKTKREGRRTSLKCAGRFNFFRLTADARPCSVQKTVLLSCRPVNLFSNLSHVAARVFIKRQVQITVSKECVHASKHRLHSRSTHSENGLDRQ